MANPIEALASQHPIARQRVFEWFVLHP